MTNDSRTGGDDARTIDVLAQKLRESYGQAHGNRTLKGEVMPTWNTLSESDAEKTAWRAVAKTAIEMREHPPGERAASAH